MRACWRLTLAGNGIIALDVQNVFSGYGEIEVLKDVSLSVRENDIVAIIGANGAGKSTLLKTIFGLVRPTSGTIQYHNEDIVGKRSIDILRKGISFIPGGRSNFPAMTVQENLEMGAFIRNDPRQIAEDIASLCERFPILREKRYSPIGNLSGGQQQMVEMGIALMLNPTLLLIDEPTIGLAPLLVDEIFRVIQEINANGTTIVLVEQNAKRALEIADYAYVLELGQVKYEGIADDLANFEEVYRAYLSEH